MYFNSHLFSEAFRKCTFFFEVLSLKLLNPIDCNLLPQSDDPSVCVGQAEHDRLQRTIEAQGKYYNITNEYLEQN